MGKAAKRKKAGKKAAVPEPPLRSSPNWPVLALAGIGMALAAYLTYSSWAGQTVAGCTQGSGCDLVLNSRWSTLLGLPTSLWGFFAYAALAGTAFVKRADLHWKLAWTIAGFGVLYSLYLTSVSLFVLEAACPYCLTSLALMVAILGTVVYQRPESLPRFSWSPWIFKTAGGALLLVLALHLHYLGLLGKGLGPEDPKLRSLAEHLTKVNAKFYGASWCPHCQDQKQMFGSSASRLPYVECSLSGRRGAQAKACDDAGVKVYPTWIIDGKRHEGVLTPGQLAQMSAFKGDL